MTTLLVASTGGHLAELYDLVPRLDVDDGRCWVTFDSPQSRSLLAGEEVLYVPPATSRDVAGTFRDFLAASDLLRHRRFTKVISTGASIALAFFVPAAAVGIECYYIESATRIGGPSLTGRLVTHVPRTHLYTQYAAWANRRWQYRGSIFDAYCAEEEQQHASIQRIVVMLGTHEKYRFPRLLSRLIEVLPRTAEIVWQVGATQVDNMPTGACRQVPYAEMQSALENADLVITHAGVGSILAAMQTEHCAICVPRRHRYGEHVDDHQVELARELDSRRLVVAREADAIKPNDLELATSWRVRHRADAKPFRLAQWSPC
jgi:UDP-N-acetylglucosamine transferase subunit ALG13